MLVQRRFYCVSLVAGKLARWAFTTASAFKALLAYRLARNQFAYTYVASRCVNCPYVTTQWIAQLDSLLRVKSPDLSIESKPENLTFLPQLANSRGDPLRT